MSTRTLLIVAGVAALAGGVWYYQRRNKMAADAAAAERLRLALLTNPQRVADVLRAETERRNAGGNLWRAMNQQKA